MSAGDCNTMLAKQQKLNMKLNKYSIQPPISSLCLGGSHSMQSQTLNSNAFQCK